MIVKNYISFYYSLKSSFIEVYFVHELFVFKLSFNSSLYILDPSPLSVILFLKYSLSVYGFLIFLVLSFEVFGS